MDKLHDLFFSSRASFSIYAPFLSTTFHHLCDNFVIASAQNCSVFWRRRNVPTRPFNFSNKTSSYGRGNFVTSGISDNLSVQDGQKMANEVQHPFFFVLRRSTRLVLHCLGEPYSNSRQSNEKQVLR